MAAALSPAPGSLPRDRTGFVRLFPSRAQPGRLSHPRLWIAPRDRDQKLLKSFKQVQRGQAGRAGIAPGRARAARSSPSPPPRPARPARAPSALPHFQQLHQPQPPHHPPNPPPMHESTSAKRKGRRQQLLLTILLGVNGAKGHKHDMRFNPIFTVLVCKAKGVFCRSLCPVPVCSRGQWRIAVLNTLTVNC